jgi:hypothetical protein
MKLTFHIEYDSGEKEFDYLDSYSGSESLSGISRVLLISLNAYFNRESVTHVTSVRGFRIVLGKSRSGSWHQAIDLIVTDPQLLDLIKDLGKNALYDLLKFVFLGGVGIPFVLKHRKAKNLIKKLREEKIDLQEKLDNALKRAHTPVKQQGLTVSIKAGQTPLVVFNKKTLEYLETEIVEDEVRVEKVCVSRFNTRTGTGRFITAIDASSYPFYPEGKLSEKFKSILAENLAELARGYFDPITVYVSRVNSQDGRLKSYRVYGIKIGEDIGESK